MSRLIDADALIEHLRKDPLFCMVERYGIEGVIDNAPTIEPSGDLVSRADAKREVYLLGKNPSINDIWDCINSLPSADRPQVNSAEWVAEKEKEFEELNRPKEDNKSQPYVPEASTERVVHCKDCVYSEEIRDGNDMFACNNMNGMPGYVRGDEFCSSGSL